MIELSTHPSLTDKYITEMQSSQIFILDKKGKKMNTAGASNHPG